MHFWDNSLSLEAYSVKYSLTSFNAANYDNVWHICWQNVVFSNSGREAMTYAYDSLGCTMSNGMLGSGVEPFFPGDIITAYAVIRCHF